MSSIWIKPFNGFLLLLWLLNDSSGPTRLCQAWLILFFQTHFLFLFLMTRTQVLLLQSSSMVLALAAHLLKLGCHRVLACALLSIHNVLSIRSTPPHTHWNTHSWPHHSSFGSCLRCFFQRNIFLTSFCKWIFLSIYDFRESSFFAWEYCVNLWWCDHHYQCNCFVKAYLLF